MKTIMPRWKAYNHQGRLMFEQNEKLKQYLETLPEEVEVIISAPRKYNPRSLNQNRYYWGCVLPLIAENTGYTNEEVHELMKHLFLSKPYYIGNRVARIPISTTTLSTSKMEEYLSKIRQWASIELAVYIPLPNEVDIPE